MKDHWKMMVTAPMDGSAILGFGVHTGPHPTAARGVTAGDRWMAIMLWDVWREPHQWVFAKDGEPVWSQPLCWINLPLPPRALIQARVGSAGTWESEEQGAKR